MALLNFDASQVAPATALDPVPAGWYTAMMVESEMKPTADGTGHYLETVNAIIEPAEYAGRKVYDRINMQNKNPVAVEIGYKTLSAICHAVGIIQVQDSQQLHNRPFAIKVSLRPAGPGADGKMYEASNDVKGYRAANERTSPAPSQVVPPPPAGLLAKTQWAPPAQAQVPPPQQAPAPQWAPPPAQPAPQQGAPAPQWAPPATPAAQTPTGAPPWANQQQAPQAGAPTTPPWVK